MKIKLKDGAVMNASYSYALRLIEQGDAVAVREEKKSAEKKPAEKPKEK